MIINIAAMEFARSLGYDRIGQLLARLAEPNTWHSAQTLSMLMEVPFTEMCAMLNRAEDLKLIVPMPGRTTGPWAITDVGRDLMEVIYPEWKSLPPSGAGIKIVPD